ncbi:MAG: MmcQ/YjbR family DNA-binding protein [Thermomicrobiales bacterium]
MATIDDVRRIALSLPETMEKPLYGTPGFRVKDKAFARLREEGDVLVVWCADEDEKEARIATQPETFFTLPHYAGYPLVLVRLPAIGEVELREVLTDAWSVRAPRRLVTAFDADSG